MTNDASGRQPHVHIDLDRLADLVADRVAQRLGANDRRDNLSTAEAAKMLGVSTATLESHRHRGIGLPYCRLGGRVIYRRADVEQYLARHTEGGAR